MTDEGLKLLCRQILIRAVDDYKKLLKGRKPKKTMNIKECEQFFRSSYCSQMLEVIGINMTGQEVIDKLKWYVENGK